MSLRLPALLYRISSLTVFTAGAFMLFVVNAHAQNKNLEDALGLPPPVSEAEPITPVPVAEPTPAQGAAAEQDVSDLLKKIENDEATRQPAPIAPIPAEAAAQVAPAESAVPTTEPEVIDEASAPAPASDVLASPDVDVHVDTNVVTTATDVPVVPSLPAAEAPNENMFFDSESLVPEGEMATTAPRKVNPQLEPATKLIVVTKNAAPGSQQAQLVSAQRAISLGRYDSALRIYNEMYRKNSRDPNVLLGRAVALQKLGQNEEAVAAYEQALDASPESTEAQINMLGLLGERYPAVALQRLKEMNEDSPNDPRVLAQIAVVDARLGHYDEALSALGIAASIDQDNALHLFNMAVIADRAGKKSQAVTYYEKALETDTIYGGGRSVPREAIYDRLSQIR